MDDKEKLELAQLRAEHKKIVEQRRKYTARRLVRISLLEKKAIAAGLFVTDKEVDDEMKRRAAKK